MEANETTFAELLRNTSGSKYLLPDRFFKVDIGERLWQKILPQRYKLKEYADFASRTIDWMTSRKLIKMAPPAMKLSLGLGSVEMRHRLYNTITERDFIGRDIIIERSCDRLFKKLSRSFIEQTSPLDPGLFEGVPLIKRSGLLLLEHFNSEESYNNLSWDEMDVADFCLNIILCTSKCDNFIVRFLDTHAWLKEKQLFMYQAVKDQLDSRETDGFESLEDACEIWGTIAKRFGAIIPDDEFNYDSIFRSFELLQDLQNDPVYSPKALLDKCLELDAESLKHHTCEYIEAFSSDDDEKLKSSLVERYKSQLDFLDANAPNVVLNAKNVEIIRQYREKDLMMHKNGKDAIELFLLTMENRNQVKDRIGAIIKAGNATEMGDLVDLGTNLKTLTETFDAEFEKLSRWFEGILQNYTSTILQVNACPEPEPKKLDQESDKARAAQDRKTKKEITDLKNINGEQASKIQTLENELSKAIAAAREAKAHEAEMTQINEQVMDELTQVKQSLHAAKSIPIVSQGGPELSTEISADWLRNVLKEEGRSTPEQILVAYATIAPDRLEVLPSALKSARAADNFELPSRLSVLIDLLIYPYLDSIRSGRPDAEAKDILGNNYAANESQTVSSNSRLRSLREFDYKGETIFFKQHVGIGNGYGTQRAIRIHFKMINNRIVIAYLGEHLETMRTS